MTPNLFNNTNILYNELHTLMRTGYLHQNLLEDKLEDLKTLWHRFLSDVSEEPIEKKKESLRASLTPISPFVAGLVSDKLSSKELMDRAVNSYINDTESAKFVPFYQSCKGDFGPTILVGISRTSRTIQFVQKWTTCNEFFANRIYSVFSQMLEDSPIKFHVPTFTFLDFQAGTQSLSDGTVIFLDSTTNSELEKTCNKIKQLIKKRSTSKWIDNQVMISEKIQGANLFDFVRNDQYKALSHEQKIILFKKFGALSFVDILFMGNLDRLAMPTSDLDTKEYSFEFPLQSNVGNILVKWDAKSDSMPELYAIDNGTYNLLLSDPEESQAYHNFLTQSLESDVVRNLQTCVIDSLNQATQTEALQEFSENLSRKEIQAFTAFNQDLLEIAPEAVYEGILQAQLCIAERLLSFLPQLEQTTSSTAAQAESLAQKIAIFRKSRSL